MTKLTAEQKFKHLVDRLNDADIMFVNDSSDEAKWSYASWAGSPTNEVLSFSWTDREDGEYYSIKITEEGIAEGTFDGHRFRCLDHEGDPAIIRAFKLTAFQLNP